MKEYRSFEFKLNDVSDSGRFQGYAAIFGNVDLGNDVVEPGAFEQSLKDTGGGKIPILDHHNPAATKHKFYIKDDGAMYSLDSAGDETPIGRRGLKNILINGGFRLWQRATSSTGGGYSTADRWLVTFGSGAAITTSRQAFTLGQSDVPGEPEFYIDLNRTTVGSTASTIRQRIEDVRTMAGQSVTVSFYAKATAAFDISTDFNQVFGTGGSPSAAWDGPDQTHSLTTSWQRFAHTVSLASISGKTLGTNNNDYLVVRFLWSQANGATETISIAHVQVEAGKADTEFEQRPLSLELDLAQRYYEKSFPMDTVPAQNAGRQGATEAGLTKAGVVTSIVIPAMPYKVRKRATPTLVFYNPSAANAFARNQSRSDDATATTMDGAVISDSVIAIQAAGLGTWAQGDTISVHWAADAEL